jgi:hypothetical protein
MYRSTSLVTLTMSALLLAGCIPDWGLPLDPQRDSSAGLKIGQPFTLKVGNQVRVAHPKAKDRLEIRFLRVSEDSRCPSDVVCVWEGNAQIQLELALEGRGKTVIALNSALKPQEAIFAAFRIKLLSLEPYPKSTRPIHPRKYRAKLIVEDANSPEELPVIFSEDFENGLDRWKLGADVPTDPNRPKQEIEWHIKATRREAHNGAHSAEFSLDGSQDDGTIWLAHSFAVPAGKPVVAHLSFSFWSEEESFNKRADVVAYAGAQPPMSEDDFSSRQPANQEKGWKQYHFPITVSQHGGTVWVALGISAAFETKLTYYIDNVKIQIE